MNIEDMIIDIKKALNAEAFYSAIALMLVIPDICSKIEYDYNSNKRRYIMWWDKYIGNYEKPPFRENQVEMPYLSGEVAYQLRCSILHNADLDIDKKCIKNESCKIDKFKITTIKNRLTNSVVSSNETFMSREYELNIYHLWMIIQRGGYLFYQNMPNEVKNNSDKICFIKTTQ